VYPFPEKLKALHEASIELTKIDAFDSFCRRAVELGRDKLGFDRLGLWLFDEKSDVVSGTYGTDEQGNLRDERALRYALSQETVIQQLLADKARARVWDDMPQYDDRKNLVGRGWQAVAILWDGDTSVGWINADNLLTRQPFTPEQVEILMLYANTLGHLVTRKRAEQALRERETAARQFEQQLRLLQEVNLELAATDSIDELCRRLNWGGTNWALIGWASG
jgi:GAF domain-containing protein